MSVKKEECLDLPPLVRKTIKVELSPEQKKLYKQMKEELVAFVNDKACVASIALVKALRLMQITSGFITAEDEDISFKKTPRREALKELLEQITPHSKVLIWSVFKDNYKTIREVSDELKIK